MNHPFPITSTTPATTKPPTQLPAPLRAPSLVSTTLGLALAVAVAFPVPVPAAPPPVGRVCVLNRVCAVPSVVTSPPIRRVALVVLAVAEVVAASPIVSVWLTMMKRRVNDSDSAGPGGTVGAGLEVSGMILGGAAAVEAGGSSMEVGTLWAGVSGFGVPSIICGCCEVTEGIGDETVTCTVAIPFSAGLSTEELWTANVVVGSRMRLPSTMLIDTCEATTGASVATSAPEDSTLAGGATIPAVTLPSSSTVLVGISAPAGRCANGACGVTQSSGARPRQGSTGSPVSTGESETKMKEKERRSRVRMEVVVGVCMRERVDGVVAFEAEREEEVDGDEMAGVDEVKMFARAVLWDEEDDAVVVKSDGEADLMMVLDGDASSQDVGCDDTEIAPSDSATR